MTTRKSKIAAEADAITEAQRDHWQGVAPAWDRWWPVIEAGARPVSEALLDMAKLAPGNRVLDLASGIGEPAAGAARRVGPEGRVVATDLAPAMVDRGRQRARRLGLDNLEFRVMDAAAPDLPAASMEAVLCRWGLMFVADLPATLARLHDLLVPGGRLAAAVWAAPDKVPSISLPGRIMTEVLDLPPPGKDDRTPFQLADIDALEAVLKASGLVDVQRRDVMVTFDFASAEDYLAFTRESSHIRQKTAQFEPKRRAAVWQALNAALLEFRTSNGRIVFENQAVCVAGTKP